MPTKGLLIARFLNSDAREFGGANIGNLGGKWSEDWAFHSRAYSLDLTLPPLSVIMLKLDVQKTEAAELAAGN